MLPKAPSFLLLSQPGNTYTLITNPSIASGIMQASDYQLIYGDVLANGFGSVLIKASGPSMASFVVAMTTSNQLQLVQQLTSQTLGVDLGTQGVTVSLQDRNSDGRSDLIVSSNNRIGAIFLADSQGRFVRNDDASIQAVWSGLLDAFKASDPTKASLYFVDESQADYKQAFTDISASLPSIPAAMSSLQAMSKNDTYAEYVFSQTVQGTTTVHIVPFVRRGVWSILGF
jgi:hypothetical protein